MCVCACVCGGGGGACGRGGGAGGVRGRVACHRLGVFTGGGGGCLWPPHVVRGHSARRGEVEHHSRAKDNTVRVCMVGGADPRSEGGGYNEQILAQLQLK